MVSGNVSDLVQISKTQFIIAKGMGLTVPQLANKYQLSNSQIKLAMEDMGLIKKEMMGEVSGELTAREKLFNDVAETWTIEPNDLHQILEQLGLEYKTGRRSTKGMRKFTIIDDLTATA
jgi:hypothetical protein